MNPDSRSRLCPDHRGYPLPTSSYVACAQARRIAELEQTVERLAERVEELESNGDDIGLASKAMFSRTKNGLEDQGLITTEKVPIDIGRPRQRLVLDDHLREVEASDLPDAARDMLESTPA